MIRPRTRTFFLSVSLLMLLNLAHGMDENPGQWSLIRLQNYSARRESSSNRDLNKNNDARPIEPGQTLTLGELEGPGVITHLWVTIATDDPFYGRSLVLRIYWDGAEKPSVETPLGDFFGVGHGVLSSFESIPVSTSSFGRAVNCYWKMPFRRSAKVTVTNDSAKYRVGSFYYYLDWQKHESLPEDIAYFHARYRQEHPARPGRYAILETAGRGHYAGTVYSVLHTDTGWFGEGDDFFYLDGEERPSIRGTGTEDYFGDAWGFRQFSSAYHGVSLWEGSFAGDRGTAYRWHLTDPVPFASSLKLEIEHRGSVFNDFGIAIGGFIERPDWVSSVAFWYQTPPVFSNENFPSIESRTPPYRIFGPEDLIARGDPAAGLTKNKEAILYIPRKPDAKLEIEFEVAEKGRYRIDAAVLHSVFGSRYQPFIDDKPAGPELDLCNSGYDPILVRLDLHDLEPGKHVVRFEGRGESPHKRTIAPPMHAIGIRNLTALRLEDIAGYHQALKSGARGQGAE